jgi:energy-converting hydrogenase Eha subunit C
MVGLELHSHYLEQIVMVVVALLVIVEAVVEVAMLDVAVVTLMVTPQRLIVEVVEVVMEITQEQQVYLKLGI